jgi:DNA-binding transcriptional LysR family regulator
VGDTEKITDMVADGELTCGITGAELERADLEFKRLFKDTMVVIAAPELMQGKTRISARQLPEYPWISREQGSGTRRAVESAMESAGIDRAGLNTAMVVDSTQAVIQFARAGLGISATSRLAAAEYLETGRLTEVQIEGLDMQRWFYLVSHRRRHFFPAVRKFIDFVEEKAGA